MIIRVLIFIFVLLLSIPVCAAGPETIAAVSSESAGPEIPRSDSEIQPAEETTMDDFQTLDAMFSLYQPYLKNISAYKPLYFLVGADPEESKFQISLKYRILSPDRPEPRKYRWKENFYIAYTQTSFWDLDADSQPFKDTSYKPEFFFLSPNVFFKKSKSGRLFFQSGFQHESNGRGEDFSRSTNFFYFQPIFIYFHQASRLGFMVSPKFWAYIGNDDDTNPDLNNYRGYFDLEIKAGKAERLTVGTHFRLAKEGASVQVDLTYPLDKLLSNNLNLYVQVQYVNALAESLLNYKNRTRALRFGFAIVR